MFVYHPWPLDYQHRLVIDNFNGDHFHSHSIYLTDFVKILHFLNVCIYSFASSIIQEL